MAAGTGGATGVGGMTASGGRGGSIGDAGTMLDALRDAGVAGDAALEIAMDAPAPIQGPQSFHCVNWADPRDNYVNGLLALSGLSSSADTYATVESKANDILSEFESKLGANAIRIPINEPTVSGAWWNAYKAVIDTAVGKGMKVIVAYWAYQNGKPDNAADRRDRLPEQQPGLLRHPQRALRLRQRVERYRRAMVDRFFDRAEGSRDRRRHRLR
jgi:hypothetical protein